MSAINFSAYSQYYDLLYKTKDYESEVKYVHDLITYLSTDARDLLELGSGTGKHAKLLAAKGYNITGVERSEEMVIISNKEPIAGAKFKVGDITNFDLANKFDVALSLFHVISYLNDNDSIIKTFTNVARHLKTNGYFIFDVWYTPAVYSQRPETRIKRIENDDVKVVRCAESTAHYRTNVVDVNYEIIVHNKHSGGYQSFSEIHPMRHFTEPEIDMIAKLTGFKLVRVEEFLTGAIPGPDTWGVCFVLQKV